MSEVELNSFAEQQIQKMMRSMGRVITGVVLAAVLGVGTVTWSTVKSNLILTEKVKNLEITMSKKADCTTVNDLKEHLSEDIDELKKAYSIFSTTDQSKKPN